MDGDDLIMELERDQARREYLAMRAQQDRLHAATCAPEIREQARQIVEAFFPRKI